MRKTRLVTLHPDQQLILTTIKAMRNRATLSELTDEMLPMVRVPKKWHYHIEVRPESRRRWIASLRIRCALQPLLRNKLIYRPRPATHALTAKGKKLVAILGGR